MEMAWTRFSFIPLSIPLFVPSVVAGFKNPLADPAVRWGGGGGGKKYVIYVATSGSHLFSDLFLQGQGVVPLASCLPGSATGNFCVACVMNKNSSLL